MAVSEELRNLLKDWNGGVYRGAPRRLSKELGIEESTMSDCLNGRQAPSEKILVKMSQIFNKPEEEIKKILNNKPEDLQYVQNNIKSKGHFNQIINGYKAEIISNQIKILESKFDSLSSKLDLLIQIVKGSK